MDNLPIELLGIIFSYLAKDRVEDLLVVRRVCTRWKRAFEKNIGTIDIDLCEHDIKDDDLKLFRGVRKISLRGCKNITDKGLSILQPLDGIKTIEWIDLSYCRKITDEGMIYLEGVSTINLYDCYISNWALDYLKDVKNIKWDENSIISDGGLAKFKHLDSIDICGGRITDEGLANLQGVKKVEISHLNITDEGLHHLRNADYVSLHSCDKITDKGISYLNNVRRIYINYCKGVTEKCLIGSNTNRKVKLWPLKKVNRIIEI